LRIGNLGLGTDLRQHSVVAGLGGRPITRASLRGTLLRALEDDLPPLTFLDLDRRLLATAGV
jgi:pyruvate ferredoxin oxidoreductase alpha subunit